MSEDLRAWSCTPASPAPPSRPGRRPHPAPRSRMPSAGRARRGLATAALAALLGGCLGGEEFQYPNTNLGGDVTLDGSPIDEGSISFLSLRQEIGQVVHTRIVRGRYIADKVPLGKVLAVISVIKKTGRMLTENGQQIPETINLVPPRYQNGFELDVTSDTSQVDFKMTHEGAVPQAGAAPRPAASGDAGPGAEKGESDSNAN